jgi:hypothetical protein
MELGLDQREGGLEAPSGGGRPATITRGTRRFVLCCRWCLPRFGLFS